MSPEASLSRPGRFFEKVEMELTSAASTAAEPVGIAHIQPIVSLIAGILILIITSQVAAAGAPDVEGLVFLGYPLHPPGRPDQLRAKHLLDRIELWLRQSFSKDKKGALVPVTPAE